MFNTTTSSGKNVFDMWADGTKSCAWLSTKTHDLARDIKNMFINSRFPNVFLTGFTVFFTQAFVNITSGNRGVLPAFHSAYNYPHQEIKEN